MLQQSEQCLKWKQIHYFKNSKTLLLCNIYVCFCLSVIVKRPCNLVAEYNQRIDESDDFF